MSKIKSIILCASMCAVFYIGNSVINLPFAKYGSCSLLGFVLAFVITLPLIYLQSMILIKCKNESISTVLIKSKSISAKSILVVFCIYALFCGLACTRNFITFSDRIILPEISSFFPVILFLLVLALMCSKEKDVLLKISFVSFTLIVIIALILFFFQHDEINLSNFKDFEFNIKGIFYEALGYFALSFSQGIILLFFISGYFTEKPKKTLLSGFLLGGAFLLLTLIQSIGVFSVSLLNELKNPYASAMSIISFGEKFTRMEGFSYFIFFGACLIKSTVCLKTAKEAFTAVFSKGEKLFMPIVLIIYGVFSIFVDFFKNAPILTIAPFLCIPPIIISLWLYCTIKKQ